MSDERYPVGRFDPAMPLLPAERAAYIDSIRTTPERLLSAISGLDEAQLDTPYRDGGWTVRQVVHHIPDSHLNAYVRMKLALTEDTPTIKPYDESKWAELPEARTGPVEMSLDLLEALHGRWDVVLRALSDTDYAREIQHPEYGWRMNVGALVRMYEWHGRHHVAHIVNLRNRMGW